MGLNHVPGGVAADGSDNIIYASGKTVTGFEHPHCGTTDITP
jgi:hypothetical protein